jgi:hypothetical protein
MRRLLIIPIALATLAVGPVAEAGAKTISVRLDAYSDSTREYTPPATSSSALKRGTLYVATAQGTFSFYPALDYNDPQVPFTAVCGTPLAAPLLNSAGGTGKVGDDPEFDFARLSKTTCAGQMHAHHWKNFQVNDGAGWSHPQLATARPITRPTATHAYNYGLVGRGRRVSFRILDTDTRDDYGAVQITIRPATHASCAGSGYRAFGLANRSECLNRTIAGPAPVPANLHQLALNQSPVLHVLRNSDVPTSPNQELPAGALAAEPFAALVAGGLSTVPSTTDTLLADGFVSAAISEHRGPDLPDLTSTAVLYRTAAAAQSGLAFESALASAHAPPNSTVAVTPAAAPGDVESVTFTPTTAGGPGGDELLIQVGAFVYDLRAVETADQVSPTQTEVLLNTVVQRATA